MIALPSQASRARTAAQYSNIQQEIATKLRTTAVLFCAALNVASANRKVREATPRRGATHVLVLVLLACLLYLLLCELQKTEAEQTYYYIV